MMDFFFAFLKVIAGVFILFTIARMTYPPMTRNSGWMWVIFIGGLAVANMLVHRSLGSPISPPFYTAIFFGITLNGLAPTAQSEDRKWHKKAIYAVFIGTLVGWMSYAELVTV